VHESTDGCITGPKSRALQGLHGCGFELVSTGGTAATIESAGVPVQRIEDLTGFPEMLDGRVKTLHPAVHGGILARRDIPAHMDALQRHSISPIHVVVVNLYPFRASVTADPAPQYAAGVENIDIGGPAMIRAAAKNHAHVTVVVDPSDYMELLECGLADGDEAAAFRRKCAWKAFQVGCSASSCLAL
jgi:phosphoribosylaminoimidazolecarboxamide formyltransferase / IMP cyclohydrolase